MSPHGPSSPKGEPTDDALLLRERRFLLVFLVVAGALALWVLRPYLGWALLGLILGHLIYPRHLRLSRRLGGAPMSAALLVTGVSLAVATPLFLLGYSIAGDVLELATTISENGLPTVIERALARVVPPAAARDVSDNLAAQATDFALSFAPTLVEAAIDASVGVLILGSALFSFLLKRGALMDWVKGIVPLREERQDALLAEVGRGVEAVVYGIVVVALVQAATGGLLWWWAGLENPAFWTAVIFAFSMVPALGPSLVILPAGGWAYVQGNYAGAGILIVGGLITIGIIDVFLRPALIGRRGGLDSTLILLSVLGGIATLGPIGIFVGPLVVAVFLHVVKVAKETWDPEDPTRVLARRRPAPGPEPPSLEAAEA